MISLKKPVRLTRERCESPNLAGLFDKEDLAHIGRCVVDGYKLDKESRRDWERRLEAAFNLALQLQEEKTFPWPGCSNVKFPLVTIAAIQWHSRAYPLLCQGPDIVKMRVNVPDAQGEIAAAANRVASFMSWQLLEDSPSWEAETDRSLIQVPIVGCAFKKTYRGADARNVSELVPARDFVINYWAKSIPDAERKTHFIPFTRNQVYERCMSGVWLDCLEEAWYKSMPSPRPITETGQDKVDRRTGMQEPSRSDETTPFRFLEQHVRMDLDDDGYAEPYVITVEESSGWVVRIMANCSYDSILWKDEKRYKIIRIAADEYFTKIPFIPSPDGGIYDIGFGVLLGPLNEAVDTLINQLIDAGTMNTTAGGFLGRGVKIRGGEYSFRPFGWQRVDSTGEDLAKGIFPFPSREPSLVLFNLLTLLVEYTNRISGSTDIMVGENPGQNTPAETSRLMAEQGAKINAAIFKRVWHGLKEEFQKLYLLNRKHTPITVLKYGSQSGWVKREDFQLPLEAICPAADPNLSSDTARVQQAMMVKQNAMTTPGYDRDAVERMLLRAMKVEGIEALFPGANGTPPPKDPKVTVAEIQAEAATQKAQGTLQGIMAQLSAEAPKIAAEIEVLRAQAEVLRSEVGEKRDANKLQAVESQHKARSDMLNAMAAYIKATKEEKASNAGK